MVIVKASSESEAGIMPTQDLLERMTSYNEQLVEAGILRDGDGLQPSSRGTRIHFSGEQCTVTEGPFPATKELVAGFWIWEVESMQEAIDWLKKAPFENDTVEIRPFYETEDFGDEMTPELRAREQSLREVERTSKAAD